MAKGTTKAAPAASTAAAAPAEKTEAKPTVAKIEQNGITRPKDGTTTGRVWAIADEISAAKQRPAERSEVIEQVVAEKINSSTGATQYGKWRKFHGLVGEKSPGRTSSKAEAAPATAPVAPAA